MKQLKSLAKNRAPCRFNTLAICRKQKGSVSPKDAHMYSALRKHSCRQLVFSWTLRVPKGKESPAQMTAGAPVETAGGPTAAAAGAGASMFGDMFSPFASLRRFGNGITGEMTAPLLLLSYRPEQRNQRRSAWPSPDAQLLLHACCDIESHHCHTGDCLTCR